MDRDVDAIRRRYAQGESGRSLAKAFAVSPSTVSLIVNGKHRVTLALASYGIRTEEVARLVGLSQSWINLMQRRALLPRTRVKGRWDPDEVNLARSLAVERAPLSDRRGERNPQSTLTEAAVAEIRRIWARQVTIKDLAGRFGVTTTSIWNVIKGRTWTDSKEPTNATA